MSETKGHGLGMGTTILEESVNENQERIWPREQGEVYDTSRFPFL